MKLWNYSNIFSHICSRNKIERPLADTWYFTNGFISRSGYKEFIFTIDEEEWFDDYTDEIGPSDSV